MPLAPPPPQQQQQQPQQAQRPQGAPQQQYQQQGPLSPQQRPQGAPQPPQQPQQYQQGPLSPQQRQPAPQPPQQAQRPQGAPQPPPQTQQQYQQRPGAPAQQQQQYYQQQPAATMDGEQQPENPNALKIVVANVDPSQAEGSDRRTKSGKFTLAQLRSTEGICPLQNGTNKFDSQKLMTNFGTPRDVKGKHLKRIWELEFPEEAADYQAPVNAAPQAPPQGAAGAPAFR